MIAVAGAGAGAAARDTEADRRRVRHRLVLPSSRAWPVRLERTVGIVERGAPVVLAMCVVLAVLGLAFEWLLRQVTDANILFMWLEAAIFMGAVAAAFALPVAHSAGQRSAAGSRHGAAPAPRRSPWLLLLMALGLCVAFALFTLSGDLEQARSYFFPWFTLRAPFALLTVCAAIWALRCLLDRLQPRAAPAAAAPPRRQGLPFAYAVLAASAAAVAASSESAEHAAALLGQTFWGLTAQSGFLAVLLACVLIEFLRVSVGALSGRSGGWSAGLVASMAAAEDPAMTGTDAAREDTRFSRLSGVAGYLLPIGIPALTLALLLGLTASEAAAALVLPFLICGALLTLPRWLTHRAAARNPQRRRAADAAPHAPSPRRSDALAASGAERSALASAREAVAALRSPRRAGRIVPGLIVLLVTASSCALMLRGYARFEEGLAVATVATAALTLLLVPPRRGDVSRFAATLTARVTQVVVYLLAGGYLYIASARLGVHDAFAALAAASGSGVIGVTGCALAVVALLRRWLPPLAVALCLLPMFPAALYAAGAVPYQVLVLYCAVLAGGDAARAYIESRGPPASPLLTRTVALFGVVLLLAAFPQPASLLPATVRVW